MNKYIVKYDNSYKEYDKLEDIPYNQDIEVFEKINYTPDNIDLNSSYFLYKDNPYKNNIWAIKRRTGFSNKQIEKLTGICYSVIAKYDRQESPIPDINKKLIEDATGYEVRLFY